jgi:hypothetical protein
MTHPSVRATLRRYATHDDLTVPVDEEGRPKLKLPPQDRCLCGCVSIHHQGDPPIGPCYEHRGCPAFRLDPRYVLKADDPLVAQFLQRLPHSPPNPTGVELSYGKSQREQWPVTPDLTTRMLGLTSEGLTRAEEEMRDETRKYVANLHGRKTARGVTFQRRRT